MTIPARTVRRLDPGRLAIQVALYVVFLWLARDILGAVLVWLGGRALGAMAGTLAGALVANLLQFSRRSRAQISSLDLRDS